MLIGPSHGTKLPQVPVEAGSIEAILYYLKDLRDTLDVYLNSIVGGAVGLAGVRGISSSGVIAQNFTKGSLAIGNQTTAVWAFANAEQNPSYLLLYGTNADASFLLTGLAKGTTNVIFSFRAAQASGMLLDICLIR